MFPFLDITTISSEALIAASRTMLKVARVDGLHPAEEELIRAFYGSCASGYDCPPFENLLEEGEYHVDPRAFNNEEERRLLLALAVVTAYADGSFSAAEQALVKSLAVDLQLPEGSFEEISNQVKDHMLAQLSHLPDAGSVAKVARELG